MEPTPGPSRSARRISADEASQRILQWIEADGNDCESDGDSFHSDSSDSDTDNDDRSRSRSRPNKRVKLAPSPAVPVVEKGKGKGKGKSGAGRVTNVRPRVDTGESDDEEQETAVEDSGPGPAGDLDEWRQVTTGATEHRIRFTPHRSPGVKEGVDTSTELKSLNLLSDDEVKDYLVNYINTFAAMKYQQNNPPKRYSVFASWYDVTRSELDKFLAVLINIGIQNKPSIKNYWSTACDSFTPWFGQMFPQHTNLNRRGFPPQLKQQRLAHLESRYYMSSDDKALCVAYKGKKAKKEVVLVSTDADVSSTPTKKVAQANAYILHVLTLLTFKRALLNQLTSKTQENTAAEPQTPARQQKSVTAVPSARMNDTRHIIVAHKHDLRCVHCSKPSAPKRTKFYCSGCPNHPHLHPVCFAPYHSSV
ncbi:hypothetical protein RRG08_055130 [Elysia crispata]|uniref:PiggyBac transposable element-derived protein domain-containing protein n=1 Tax=Elysia crispata TaxID=231223 RepID=A0AAE1AKX6_9GAST|nr:hypothetical protein RRG08_055130 [Elysia crispata]